MSNATEDLVVVSLVGFRNPDDVLNCVRALSTSAHTNYVVSICENGGKAAFDRLVVRLAEIVRRGEDRPSAVDGQVARVWSGRLACGNQPLHVFEAKANLGFAGGVNVTLRQFAGDPNWAAVWLLNPDTEADPNALSALVARARRTEAAIVGSRLVFRDSGRVQLYAGRWRPTVARGFNIGLNEPVDAPVDVDLVEKSLAYVSGASLFATRAFIEEAGPMEEGYFLYCEEVDWCFRVDPSRIRFAKDSIVYHHHGSTIGSNRAKARRSSVSVYLAERNKLILSRRFFPARYPLIVIVTFLLNFQYAVSGGWRNTAMAVRGWFAGLRGEVGLPPWLADAGSVEYST